MIVSSLLRLCLCHINSSIGEGRNYTATENSSLTHWIIMVVTDDSASNSIDVMHICVLVLSGVTVLFLLTDRVLSRSYFVSVNRTQDASMGV